MNNCIVSFICIFAMMASLISLAENEILSIRRKKQFATLNVLIVLEIIIDTCIYINDNLNSIIFKILKIIEFTLIPLIPCMLSLILSRKSFWRYKLRKYFIILIIVNAVLQTFLLIFTDGTIYTTCIYIIILILCFVLLVIAGKNSVIQSYNKVSYTLVAIEVMLFIGMIIRKSDNKINSDWMAITFGFFLFWLYFINGYARIDSLSSLLNQAAFKKWLIRINYTTAVFIIDGNKFKEINDTYGHQTGDLAISKIAEAILDVYGKLGYCFRIGGDEFAVILRPGALTNISASQKMNMFAGLNELTRQLDQRLMLKAKKYPFLRNGVAQGYAIYYDPESAIDDDYLTIDEIVKKADSWMYKKKNQKDRRLSK